MKLIKEKYTTGVYDKWEKGIWLLLRVYVPYKMALS